MNAPSVFRSRRVVLPEGVRAATVHVQDGVITRISEWDDTGPGDLADVGEAALMPGLVDTHVHINEPGRTEWEGFDTATRAAALGGVTTIVDMPLNCDPPTTTVDAFEGKLAAARGRLCVDVGFWGGVVPGNSGSLDALWKAGVLGFKAFMCPSGIDEFPASTVPDLATALAVLAPLDAPLLVHAEVPGALRAADPQADPRRYSTYLATRPDEAETQAIDALIALARSSNARVHVVHLATARALAALSDAKAEGVRLTVETCPHYLHFSAEDVPDGQCQFKCAPPIRDERNRQELWSGLRRGVIDLVASDHSPCPPALKRMDTGDFLPAWGGIASLQLSLSIVWTEAARQGLSLGAVARWMSEAPATLAALHRKGAIAPGKDADFVVFDPEAEWMVEPSTLAHRHPVTPYDRARLTGRPRATYLRGALIAREGRMHGVPAGAVLLRPGMELMSRSSTDE